MKRIIFILSCLLSICCSAQSRWAVVNTSSCNLREKPTYTSSLESQSLMGTIVEVLDREGYWCKVNVPDYKDVWVNEGVLSFMTETELQVYKSTPKYICTVEYSWLYSAASTDSQRMGDLILGDLLRVSAESDGAWTEVLMADGRKAWVHSKDVSLLSEWERSRVASESELIRMSNRFLGIPYLWGGASVKGFDCSGFVKTVYALCGITLRRNAREQIHDGKVVDYDFAQMRPGDLVFFGRIEDGIIKSVSHVAMYIGEGRIIHSSQIVKINSFFPNDRYPLYNRTPIAVRRYL